MGVFPICSVPVGSHQPGVAVGCELGLDFLLRSVGVSDWDLCARAVISEDAVGRGGCCSPLNAVRGPRVGTRRWVAATSPRSGELRFRLSSEASASPLRSP